MRQSRETEPGGTTVRQPCVVETLTAPDIYKLYTVIWSRVDLTCNSAMVIMLGVCLGKGFRGDEQQTDLTRGTRGTAR